MQVTGLESSLGFPEVEVEVVEEVMIVEAVTVVQPGS